MQLWFVHADELTLHQEHFANDLATGIPLDTFRYCLLTHVLAKEANLIPRIFKMTSANNHIYDQNMEDIKKIISRKPIKNDIKIEILNSMDCLQSIDDFVITGYNSHENLRFEVAK